MAGTIDIFPKDENLSKVESLLEDFISAVETTVLESLDTELADSLTETLKNLVDMLIYKQEKGLDISIWHKHNKSVFYMLIRCLGVYNNYKLIGKPEPEHTTEQKKKVNAILNKIGKLLPKNSSDEEEERDFFDSFVVTYFKEQFDEKEALDKCKDWTMSNYKWRMFYVVFELLEEKQLTYPIDSDATETVFDRIATIFKTVLLGSPDAKNFNVKSIVLTS